MNIPQSITVTDLRRKSASILESLDEEKLFLLLQNSKVRGALVDPEYLRMLQDAYEDYLDILTFDSAVDEPTIGWDEYKKKSEKAK